MQRNKATRATCYEGNLRPRRRRRIETAPQREQRTRSRSFEKVVLREADRRDYRDGDYRQQDACGEYVHSRRDYRDEDYRQQDARGECTHNPEQPPILPTMMPPPHPEAPCEQSSASRACQQIINNVTHEGYADQRKASHDDRASPRRNQRHRSATPPAQPDNGR